MAVVVCWEDRCTNLRGIIRCRRCTRPFCPDHMSEINLCLWCVPVDEEEYQKWARGFINYSEEQ